MVDVGAHFGTSLEPFARKGWQVYGFEPDPNNRSVLSERLKDLSTVSIDNRAVTDVSGQRLEFYTSDVSTGISGLSRFHESHRPTTTVTTVTLRDFLKTKPVSDIDFLKIDTEGFDLFVLKGFDWDKDPHPKTIVCEFEDKKTLPLGYCVNEMCEYLKSKGYQLIISEWHPIVQYGKRHKWKGFLKSTKQITDPNAWGNIIATKTQYFPDMMNVCRRHGPVAA